MIEIVRDAHDAETRQARHDWAEVTGQEMELKPTVVMDTKTNIRYAGIVGAIGWPTATDPGCMIIMGITQNKFDVLEFQEHRSVYNLLDNIVMSRRQYGYGKFRGCLPDWIADPDRYQALVVKMSVVLEKKIGSSYGLYIREPADWYEKFVFPLYMWQLRTAIAEKRLNLNDFQSLIGRLRELHPDMIDKGKVFDYPAVGALAGLVHTVISERMWEQDIKGE
ncbi:MAG: hypothetical protein U9N73_10425 [Candidatus Auribacterota bacterium]|nr:hypothetical protein [Candidatus Auribacterota bacterium]